MLRWVARGQKEGALALSNRRQAVVDYTAAVVRQALHARSQGDNRLVGLPGPAARARGGLALRAKGPPSPLRGSAPSGSMSPSVSSASLFKLFGNLTLLGILGVLGDVGRLAAAVGIDLKDAFSLFEHFNPGQTLPQRCRSASAPASTPRRRSRCRWRARSCG